MPVADLNVRDRWYGLIEHNSESEIRVSGRVILDSICQITLRVTDTASSQEVHVPLVSTMENCRLIRIAQYHSETTYATDAD